MRNSKLEERCINTILFLAMDMVQQTVPSMRNLG